MKVSIRPLQQDDVAFALAQTKREGWDSTAELFELCLAHDPDGSFIAEAGGQSVGMVTTFCYRQTAWIGNLIVLPQYRRCGIGTHLMTHAVAHLAGRRVRTIRLEADPPGISIYCRLGFVDEFESLRFQLTDRGGADHPATQRITAADLPAIAAFDAAHFGDRRGRLLKLLLRRARATYQSRTAGQMRGYAFVIPSHLGARIGPWVAADCQAAETLLKSILADWPDTVILVGVPCPNRDAIRLLEAYGFTRTPSSFRMIYGDRVAAGRPECMFGIVSGAMG